MRGATFEKHFKKMVPNFKEFKVSFQHKRGGETIIRFPYKGGIAYIEMYREIRGLAPWIGHFTAFFKTGKFDSFSYWDTYTTNYEEGNGFVYKVKMKLEKDGRFNVHSDEHRKHMMQLRTLKGDLGFISVSKPASKEELTPW